MIPVALGSLVAFRLFAGWATGELTTSQAVAVGLAVAAIGARIPPLVTAGGLAVYVAARQGGMTDVAPVQWSVGFIVLLAGLVALCWLMFRAPTFATLLVIPAAGVMAVQAAELLGIVGPTLPPYLAA